MDKIPNCPKQENALATLAPNGAPPNGGATILKELTTTNPKCWNQLEGSKTKPGTLAGGIVDNRAGKPDIEEALAMLNAFTSVGAVAFDITLLDIKGREQGFQSNRGLAELRRSINRHLQDATAARHSLVIRPRSTTALLIQLDDFSDEKAATIAPHAFMTLKTSPGNGQVWLAVSDGPKESDREPAKLFRTRVRRGAGADHSATGATRIAGSLNFKTKYAPDFPVVTLGQVNAGRTVTTATLEQAGLIARAEPPQPPASVPSLVLPSQAVAGRHWPDYQQALRGAPPKRDGSGPDRSLADFMFCKWAIERGWGIEEAAEKLAEVSAKAQERIRMKDDHGYTVLTARNAAAAVERDRNRRQFLKTAPRR